MFAPRSVQETAEVASSPAGNPATNPVHPLPANRTADGTVDRYSVEAGADPAVLSRAIELLAKRGLVPVFLHAETWRAADGEARLSFQIGTDALEPMAAAHVAACLRQIWGVETVAHEPRSLG